MSRRHRSSPDRRNKRAVGTLREIHNVAVRPVHAPIGGLEVEDACDIPIGIERHAADPVLRIVGKEIIALIGAWELGSVVDKTTGNRCIASGVWIGIDGIRVGGVAGWPFDVRPAVVGAAPPDSLPQQRSN